MKQLAFLTLVVSTLAFQSTSFAGCDCYCVEANGNVRGKATFPNVPDPKVYPNHCRYFCAHRSGLRGAGSCMQGQ